jgi:hypothetical protein
MYNNFGTESRESQQENPKATLLDYVEIFKSRAAT